MPQQRQPVRKQSNRWRRKRGRVVAAASLALILVVVLVAAMAATRDSTDDQPGMSANAAPQTDVAEWSPATHSGGPRLAVDRTQFDYGNVAYNEPVEATYRLKNVGDEAVIIDPPSIKTLEGC
jgi:hypothetical protein